MMTSWTALAAILLGSFSFLASPASAEPSDGLYSASTIVTGQDNLPERERGIRETFREVVARVSADASIVSDLPPLTTQDFEHLVSEISYVDRKAGIQISDEQGTRDRSFILRVEFKPTAIIDLVISLDRKPWLDPRPAVLVMLTVSDGQRTYLVSETSKFGWGQREVIKSMSDRTALPLLLPKTPESQRQSGIGNVLSGNMRVTPDGYWDSFWTLKRGVIEETWTLVPNTFDRAISESIWMTAARFAK